MFTKHGLRGLAVVEMRVKKWGRDPRGQIKIVKVNGSLTKVCVWGGGSVPLIPSLDLSLFGSRGGKSIQLLDKFSTLQ